MMILSSNIVKKTRKKCKCWGCWRTIPTGSKVLKNALVDSGKVKTISWCVVCVTHLSAHYDHDDEFYPGGLRDGDVTSWEETRKRIEDTGEPVGGEKE